MEAGQLSTWPEQTCTHSLKAHSHYRFIHKEMNIPEVRAEFLRAREHPPYLLILNMGTSLNWGELMRNKTLTVPLQGTLQQLLGKMEPELPKFRDTL